MYHWVKDKNYIKQVRIRSFDAVNRLANELNRNSKLRVSFRLVGSGKRGLITQNEKEPIDLDFNLVIEEAPNFRDCHYIKETVRQAFNGVLRNLGWGDCSDSTSALTTKKRVFNEGNQTPWSIDVAIIAEERDGSWWRLIHKKTGDVKRDSWVWEQGRDSKNVFMKEKIIKRRGYWEKVCRAYISKKNHYLQNHQEDSHPSFICFVEAVNEVFPSVPDAEEELEKIIR